MGNRRPYAEALAPQELCCERRGLVGERLREREVLILERLLGLLGESLRLLVLGLPCFSELCVIDASEIALRADNEITNGFLRTPRGAKRRHRRRHSRLGRRGLRQRS